MLNREQILAAEAEIQRLNNERDEELARNRDYERTTVNSLTDAKYEIERAIGNRRHKGDSERGEITQNFDEQLEPHAEILTEKRFLLKCMSIHKTEINLDYEVYFYDRSHCEAIKTLYNPFNPLFQDKYCIIRAYIVKNDRPKSCFCLAIVGKNNLQGLMNDSNSRYGNSYHETGANIQIELAFKPTEEEILKHYADNRKKILRDYLLEYKEKKELYEKAIKETATSEWERLSLEGEKYYYEHSYSGGTETPEYAEVCKKLKAMKTPEELQAEEDALVKKFYFPMKLVGHGKTPDEAFSDAVDGFNNDPGIMDEFEEADEQEED